VAERTLSDSDIQALAAALRSAPPAAVASSPHQRCPACGHEGVGVAFGPCPNNNCPRHFDEKIVGIHPDTGASMYDAAEHAAAVAAHKP
jgi:hypothetical protein